VTTAEVQAELGAANIVADLEKTRETLDREEEAHAREMERDMVQHRMTIEQKREAATQAAEAKKASNGPAATD
jgi:hypothetical protein